MLNEEKGTLLVGRGGVTTTGTSTLNETGYLTLVYTVSGTKRISLINAKTVD